MARFSLLLSFALFSLVVNGADKSFNIAATRDYARDHLQKRQSAIEATGLDKDLYWFGNFSVGDSGPLSLLIDTGSSDILINPGLYKASVNEKPYITKNFTIQYEGVNKAGYGFENVYGLGVVDNVTVGNLTVKHQALANITGFQFFDLKKPHKVALERDGIIGFAPNSSAFKPQATPWFFNLCDQGSVDECRFGLAFGTNGTGQLVLGKLDTTLIDGDPVPVEEVDGQYVTMGDVTLDNKIVFKNQTFIMDVGTNNIQAPINAARSIFETLGWSTHRTQSNQLGDFKPDRVLTASFPCGKPPTLGFSFPGEAQLKPGQKATIFNVSPDVWDSAKHKNGNCTSILGGTNFLTNVTAHITQWLLGQPFFAGHYIDFDQTNLKISYANLKNPATGT